MMQISQGTIGPPWHQSYHSSSSRSDLSSYDHSYLRRSPNQCSSQGSMESLEPSGEYSACHFLSPSKSISSIDQLSHLHNKRDSAYSSFSTSSSILEYPPPVVTSRERSGSMDATSAQKGLIEGMRQADIRYVKTIYDTRRGISAEYEVNSSDLLLQGREVHTSPDDKGHDKWHSISQSKGILSPSWSQKCSNSLETGPDNLPHKVGTPQPPTRSDSYAAFRNRERPSSWSSLDQKRFGRSQTNTLGPLKSPFIDEQLHTVPEKSPENSPPVKHKHNYTQKVQPGQPLLPTGIYPVSSLEPHFAQVLQPSVSSNGTLHPALAKESGYQATPQRACSKMTTFDENGNQNIASRPGFAFFQPLEHDSLSLVEKKPETMVKYIPYKGHFPSVPENEEDSSLKRQLIAPEANSIHYHERKNTHSNTPCSNHHSLKSQAQAWQVGGDKRSSKLLEPWESDFQEDHNANLRHKLDKEDLTYSQSGNFDRTKSTFSSLQNIPESLRKQNSLELAEEAQESYSVGRSTCEVNTKVEDSRRKVLPDHIGHLDRPVSYPRLERRSSTSPSVHQADPTYEEPHTPPYQQTSSLGRRLSSSSMLALQGFQYRKPHCSVLEKVSKFEQQEQRNHRPPSAGSSTYGHTYRRIPTSSTSGSDLEQAKASIHGSKATEPLGNGGQHFRNGEPKLQEAFRQPYSQQPRRTEEGNCGPSRRVSDPPRPDARLLRSQSTFQLFSKADREAIWPECRPGAPESPLLDAPFSNIYRNSIKDAQSRVLGATSFRRRDLELGALGTSRPWRLRPASAHVGLRCPEALMPASASPHTPRERHSMTPTKGSTAQPMPSPAPAGLRRGPRRRLTLEQKKRSYSEPEKMNEVGVSEEAKPSPSSQHRPGLRSLKSSSVADQRRIFEREGKACSTLNLSGPELKQFQQSALADYIERKTGKRPATCTGCGPQEPGLPEYNQNSYLQAPDSPGLASACSQSSLREPSRQPRKEAILSPPLPAAATETPRATRDCSSAFAFVGAHIHGERQFWDPQTPKEIPGDASCGRRGTQKLGRNPGGSSSWGSVVMSTQKSVSAEDLLERSDVLAAPVHVRSRSSPAADKKCQDVLLRKDSGFGFVKNLCYPADSESRFLSCPDRVQEETLVPLHPPAPSWDSSGCKAASVYSIPNECSKVGRMQGHLTDTQTATLTSLGFPLPSPITSGYCSQLASDQQSGRDGQAGQQPLAPYTPGGTHQSDGLVQPSSSEHGVEEGAWKRASLLQQPPPPQVKWAYTATEDSLSQDASAPEFANQKHYHKQHPSLLSSRSTWNPDTPRRVSLHISESALQASPPLQEDYEDEVFMKDLHKATSSPTFEAFPLLPPPPPPVNQETPVNCSDDFPPPPPQVVFEALVDSQAHEESGSSSSSKFFEMTITKERHMPGAAPTVSSQILASRPQTSIKDSENNEPNPRSIVSVQPQLTVSLSQQPSPEKPPPSQTQSFIHEVNGTQNIEKNVNSAPQKTSEDSRTETLAKEIVHQDKSLADILDPDSRMKTTMDLMEGLFPRNVNMLKENSTKRKALQRTVSYPGCEDKRSGNKEAAGVLVNCPAYYSVSAAKAELLNKIKDMPKETHEEEEQVDVNEKKAELIGSLTHKLETLQEARGSLLMDIKLNNALGEEVEALISDLCKPNEFDKYKMFIGDLDKVVNLLLSLSGRLARVENVLSNLGKDASNEERSSLNEKRKVLAGQHEDARELKENLDRRERAVLAILGNYLSEEQLQDYQHFVKMKSTLLIEQRKLDDKIKLGQEQVKCLLESLPSDFTPKTGALALPSDLKSSGTPFGCAVTGLGPTLTSPL